MADGTRTKLLEEQIRKYDQRITEFANEFQRQLDNVGSKIDREWTDQLQKLESKLDSTLEAHAANLEAKMEAKFSALIQALKRDRVGTENDKTPLLPTPVIIQKHPWPTEGGDGQKRGKPFITGLPRVELQMFTGENPKEWLRKCERFFSIGQVPEDMKVEAVELYMDGKVDVWFQKLENDTRMYFLD